MSLYTLLGKPIPTLAYCALHQPRPGVVRDEYIGTMRELHERIAQESRDIQAAYAKHLAETLSRESQSLQNALSHFLHTPISSDAEEVQRTIVESFERFKNQIFHDSLVGVERSSESRVLFFSSKKMLEKKLLKNGKVYLDQLGFVTTRGHEDIFESSFIVQGGMNVDLLEHIVRDRLGVYSTPHGKHFSEIGGYSFALYSLALTHGRVPSGSDSEKHFELTFYFSKQHVEYGPFREGIGEAIGRLTSDVGLEHVSLWQRKLGLGGGKEFVLRMVSDRSEVEGAVIEWFHGHEEKAFVKESIIGGGHLLVKELLLA